jgi:hypothetical protein
MVLARGRFDEVKIEALIRDHGGEVQEYKGKRVLVAGRRDADPDAAAPYVVDHRADFSVAFIEPGLIGVGSTSLVRTAIDLHNGGDNPQTGVMSVTGNDDLMNLVRALDNGNAWAVGRFDSLMSRARLPQGVANQIPPITWFSASAHVNGGLRGVVRAETRDDESATNLRDVVRGFMALAKLQAGSRPEMQTMLQSLELGGTGKTVALSFEVPSQVFDAAAAMLEKK